MIHLHKQLWAIVALHRDVEDSEYNLAYMTHREYGKDGEESDKFINRKSTGLSWSKGYSRDPKVKELSFDNTPVKGFGIVGSKSRWSTQNKVIQVEDPRGFVVEIPVSALTTLLKHTTVTNGVVQEECLWGREGNNHVLIPVNSEIYLKAKEDTHQYNNKTKLSQLKEGNRVKFSVDGSEYIYAGKYKTYWEVSLKYSTEQGDRYCSRNWVRKDADKVLKSEIVAEDGYKHLFLRVEESNNYNYPEFKQSGECIVISDESYEVKLRDNLTLYSPKKIDNHYGEDTRYNSYWQEYSTVKLHKLEKKETL